MADPEHPQIYLVTPPEIELSRFPDTLARVLDSTEIACVRLALATRDEDHVSRTADALREVTHARDVALVISEHLILAERLGLDGVHLTDGARSVRKSRKALGDDAIVGAFCGASRHDGLSAGEAGADYVSFGPVGRTPLGDGEVAESDLFAWWSDVVEIPVVAEGALDEESLRRLAPITDFFAIGEEIWRADDPITRLAELRATFI
ncbi:thiamine-phosphate pyrophosphorylase [Salinihabitans flavidus]|uniref:Thiamine-phosphate pyrophosphorylase n=1 Tax=Salinihabitans flavidus TaxID=569882 RepID=A0A1H8TYI8_9RHOB|nr:thiamine phosphate synthase [Salinihabitans flavidus]SEO95876.1 thiamine-phosphate pyrophosphorylase [Salinihabitans flavidus]